MLALVAALQLEPGLLAGKLVPLQTRLNDLIEKNRLSALVTAHKVRVSCRFRTQMTERSRLTSCVLDRMCRYWRHTHSS